MKEPIPGSHMNSPDYTDVEARIYQDRLKELTAGDRMTAREAAHVLAREDNEKAMKAAANPHEYVPFAERPPMGWQVREAAERQSGEAEQPSVEQTPDRNLTFSEDREPHRPNYALLKEETAKYSQNQETEVSEQQQAPEQTPERTLTFFEDRQPSRPNYAQLREETAAAIEAQKEQKVPANDGPTMEAPQGEQMVSLKTETPEQHQTQEPNAPANDPEPTRPERVLKFHEDRHPGQQNDLSR
jgi:hypothetical protein